MVATLPSSLGSGHEPSGIEISELLTAITALSNYNLFMSLGGVSLSTTSASYVNVQNATWNFTKLGDATESDVLIVLGISSYVAATPNYISYTVAEGFNTHDTHFCYFNAVEHMWSWGLTRISLMTPNTYTFQVQASVTGGTTASVDSNDSCFALTLEIPL